MAGRNFLFFTVLLSLVVLTLARTTKQSNTPVVDNRNGARPSKVELVVASGQGDDPAWVKDAVSDWPAQVYTVDEAEGAAMAFLTYIIDNYHQLPSVTVFHHAKRYQMRPDNRVFDSALVLQQLRTDHVMKRGFANLHCGQQIECPDSILTKHEHSWILSNINEVAAHFKRDFEALLPGEPVPEKVAVPTGSEFAVADWAIRQRSKKDWQRIRQWVMDSKHKPAMTEGIINHAWHILFGMKAYECPEPQECSCLTFGLCGDNTGAGQQPMQATLKSGVPSTARGSRSGRDYTWLQTSPLRKRSE